MPKKTLKFVLITLLILNITNNTFAINIPSASAIITGTTNINNTLGNFNNKILKTSDTINQATQTIGNTIGLGSQIYNQAKNLLPTNCNSLTDIKNGCPPPTPFCQNNTCNIVQNTKLLSTQIDNKILKTGTLADAIIFWTNFTLIFLFILSVAMITYGGYLMIFDLDNGGFDKGKKLITNVIIGIVIILLAYGIVNTILLATSK